MVFSLAVKTEEEEGKFVKWFSKEVKSNKVLTNKTVDLRQVIHWLSVFNMAFYNKRARESCSLQDSKLDDSYFCLKRH